MGQNGIPLFWGFFKFINKKVFFGGRNVPFRRGINVPPAHLYRSRKGTFLPPRNKVDKNYQVLTSVIYIILPYVFNQC